MDEKSTNLNLDELLTSYVDNQYIDSESKQKVQNLINENTGVWKKYHSEKLTKEFLTAKFPLRDVPPHLAQKINDSIDSVISSIGIKNPNNSGLLHHPIKDSSNFLEYFGKIISQKTSIGSIRIPRYAVGAFTMLLLFLIGMIINNSLKPKILNPYIASGSENSVMVQAVNNFHKILKGDIKPQVKSNDAKIVNNYLRDRVNFNVFIPDIEEFELMGGISNEHAGEKVVHLMYSSGNKIIYIYETGSTSFKPDKLELPEPVHQQIRRENYYMCDEVDENDCTLMMWFSGDVLCASVSNVPKQKMYSTFSHYCNEK